MDESEKARARLEGDLRRALENREFAVWRQPEVDRDGRLVGQELLLRWMHPSLGWVGAQDIIPLAEDTGLILPIGEWMLREAAHIATESPALFTAVNLSPIQLAQPEFADLMIRIFTDAGADPARVELEVTEQIHKLVALAKKENNYTTDTFLQWFVSEQLEEVSSLDNLLKVIRMAGEDGLLRVEEWLARQGGKVSSPDAMS